MLRPRLRPDCSGSGLEWLAEDRPAIPTPARCDGCTWWRRRTRGPSRALLQCIREQQRETVGGRSVQELLDAAYRDRAAARDPRGRTPELGGAYQPSILCQRRTPARRGTDGPSTPQSPSACSEGAGSCRRPSERDDIVARLFSVGFFAIIAVINGHSGSPLTAVPIRVNFGKQRRPKAARANDLGRMKLANTEIIIRPARTA